MIMTTQFVFLLVIALSASLILSLFLPRKVPRARFSFITLHLIDYLEIDKKKCKEDKIREE